MTLDQKFQRSIKIKTNNSNIMAKLKTQQFREMAKHWLQKNGWKILDTIKTEKQRWYANDKQRTQLDDLIEEKGLDTFPYFPHFLIEKDGYKFIVALFNKEDYFYSKSLEQYVTGFDYWKYEFLKEFQAKIGVPAGIIFYSEEVKEFIFRQLDELPIPIIWQRSQCLEKQYMRHPLVLNCVECRKQQRYTFRKCIKRTNKKRPMAVWDVKLFNPKTNFQIRLFNYEQKENGEVNRKTLEGVRAGS